MQALHIVKSFTFICLKITDYRAIKHSLFCLDKQVCASNITDNLSVFQRPFTVNYERLCSAEGASRNERLSVFAFHICPLGRLASLLHGC